MISYPTEPLSHPMRVVFLGTPMFAAVCLERLLEAGFQVVGVVTAPDRPGGRGMHPQPSAVKDVALHHHLPLLQPERLRDPSFQAAFRDWQADVGVVVAFRMLPESVWAAPRWGTINLHASLLPQLRGAAPIQRAILAGLTTTGVTTFSLNADIDTGDLLEAASLKIGPDETGGSLHDRLLERGSQLLVSTLRRLEAGTLVPHPQPAAPNSEGGWLEAPKLQKSDSEIDWAQPVAQVHNLVRAFSPVPGAWRPTEAGPFKVFVGTPLPDPTGQPPGPAIPTGTLRSTDDGIQVRCTDGWYRVDALQPPGKKRLSAADWKNGLRGQLPEQI